MHAPDCDRASGAMHLPCFVDDKGRCIDCGRDVRLPVEVAPAPAPIDSPRVFWTMVLLALALVLEVWLLRR